MKSGAMRRDAAREVTGPVEDYLKVIYELEKSGPAGGRSGAGTSEIAERLDLAPASVSGMVRRLAEQGLLAYERYRGVRLTDAGKRAALRTLRRHRVIESYLTQALGYPWDRVHDEAERLEHAASEELIDRMADAIGEPAFDPHGAPIPTREGRMDEREYHSLADLSVGYAAKVVRVSDEDPRMLRYLSELAILPGIELTLVSRAPFGGPLTISVDATEIAIGPALAAQILVEPLPNDDAPAY